MNTQHTPGPWEHNDFQIIAGETVIANCTYGARNSNNENDARLIAAAPDLLEALCMAHDYLAANGWDDDDRMNPIRAALDKATGKINGTNT